MAAVGRPRKSPVWSYFKYEKDADKCVCQVSIEKEGAEPVICGKELKGSYASNMKKHLKQKHKEAFTKLEQEEQKRQRTEVAKRKGKESGCSSQTTIQEALRPSSYPEGSKKQLAITKKLAIFVGATNVPLSLVDCPEFHDLLKEMDKQYAIPGRKKLGKEIEMVYRKLKNNISLTLEKAKRVSICTDIWSKQGMTASFLGVTAHFFTFIDKKRHSITLAVKRFESPHTGMRIAALLQVVMSEWKIQQKIFRALTDNGSNMIKAFREIELCLQEDSQDSSSSESSGPGDSEDEDSDSEDEDLDSDDEDSDLEKENYVTVEDEIKEFEECEEDHKQALLESVEWKRNGCFIHTLQLVVKEFEKNPCFKSTVAKAKKIVKKVNKSCKATEMLIKSAGKKLVSNCPTRWDSMFLMIERLVLLKDHVNAVLDAQGWDTFTTSQWKQLQAIHRLLQPFAHHTNITSSEENTSICMVIPVLKELDLHLKEVCNKNALLLHEFLLFLSI